MSLRPADSWYEATARRDAPLRALEGNVDADVCVVGAGLSGCSTAMHLAQRGYKVVVPVDTISSEDPYMEQYTAWHLYKGGPAIITDQVTLTRSDMIKF